MAGAVGSLLDRLEVWDLRRNQLVAGIQEGEADSISAIAFSPGGDILAVGLMAGRVHFWGLSAGGRPGSALIARRLHPLNTLWLPDQHTGIDALTFDQQGDRLLASNFSSGYVLPGSPAAWLTVAKHRLGIPGSW
jgi:hypothetical protein